MMMILSVRLSEVEALSLQGFDFAQPDKNTYLCLLYFYIISKNKIK